MFHDYIFMEVPYLVCQQLLDYILQNMYVVTASIYHLICFKNNHNGVTIQSALLTQFMFLIEAEELLTYKCSISCTALKAFRGG